MSDKLTDLPSLGQFKVLAEAMDKSSQGEWHNKYNRKEVKNQYDCPIATCHQDGREHNDMCQMFNNGDAIAIAHNDLPALLRAYSAAVAERDEALARIAVLNEALAVASFILPEMEVDVVNPKSMMLQVQEHVKKSEKERDTLRTQLDNATFMRGVAETGMATAIDQLDLALDLIERVRTTMTDAESLEVLRESVTPEVRALLAAQKEATPRCEVCHMLEEHCGCDFEAQGLTEATQ